MPTKKYILKKRRHSKIRSHLKGTAEKPRLVVFKSLLYTYAQIVDDDARRILASSSDLKDKTKVTKIEKAKKIGLDIAKKALEKKIEVVVFDRNGYKYHGRVSALADGACEGGLKF